MSAILLFRVDGECTRKDPSATAFSLREPCWDFDVIAQWTDPAGADASHRVGAQVLERGRAVQPRRVHQPPRRRRSEGAHPLCVRAELRTARETEDEVRSDELLPDEQQHSAGLAAGVFIRCQATPDTCPNSSSWHTETRSAGARISESADADVYYGQPACGAGARGREQQAVPRSIGHVFETAPDRRDDEQRRAVVRRRACTQSSRGRRRRSAALRRLRVRARNACSARRRTRWRLLRRSRCRPARRRRVRPIRDDSTGFRRRRCRMRSAVLQTIRRSPASSCQG